MNCFALLILTFATHQPTAQKAIARQGPVVIVRASSMWSTWRLTVNPDGTISARVGGRPPDKVAQVLTKEQRERLRSLVAALPKEKTGYGFGPSKDLEPTIFMMAVTVGKDERRYLVRDPLGADLSRAEWKPVLELLHFLYELLGTHTLEPPRLENESPQK